MTNSSLPRAGEGREPLTKGILCSASQQIGGGGGALFVPAVSELPAAQNNPHIWGEVSSDPLADSQQVAYGAVCCR